MGGLAVGAGGVGAIVPLPVPLPKVYTIPGVGCWTGALVTGGAAALSTSSPPVRSYQRPVPTERMRPDGSCTSGTDVTGQDSDSRVNPSSSFAATREERDCSGAPALGGSTEPGGAPAAKPRKPPREGDVGVAGALA